MTTHKLIVATGPITDDCRDTLASFAEVVELPDDEETLLAAAPDATGFVVRGTSQLSGAVIEAAKGLTVIGRSGVGVDGVDMATATRRGVPVVITPHAGVNAVAEGAFAMILTLTKKLQTLNSAVRNGNWTDRDNLVLGDLDGATLGIVGMGRIGRRVARIAAAFDMNIIVADPLVDEAEARDLNIQLSELPDLFQNSDYISLHAPLLPETRGLVSSQLLKSCRAGTILVNLARGGLLESYDAVLAALDSGCLAGLGLDVFDPEPPNLSHPLFRDDRVLLSPHALGLSHRAKQRIFQEMADGMLTALKGGRAENVANPEIYSEERQ